MFTQRRDDQFIFCCCCCFSVSVSLHSSYFVLKGVSSIVCGFILALAAMVLLIQVTHMNTLRIKIMKFIWKSAKIWWKANFRANEVLQWSWPWSWPWPWHWHQPWWPWTITMKRVQNCDVRAVRTLAMHFDDFHH